MERSYLGSMQNKEYIISIVVPCYNCEKTIENTVNRLLDQVNVNDCDCMTYQVVLVDDGSKDSTGDMCDNYSRNNDNVITLHKDNGGLVSAWKFGVQNADGKYIAFCDSDDYVDDDYIYRISGIIKSYTPDVIVFGMTIEYSNDDTDRKRILLPEGYYDKGQIEKSVLPNLLSNGDMESELIGSSRCNKVFKKALLDSILSDIPDDISYGEDDVTCFAAVLNTHSLYAISDYYPYHYVRNTESMIGGYDEMAFVKINRVYNELVRLASKYGYIYDNQIKQSILSIIFLGIKKEICRNPKGFKDVNRRLSEVCSSKTYCDCYDNLTVKKYRISKRVFATLVNNNKYLTAYFLTRIINKLRGRNV